MGYVVGDTVKLTATFEVAGVATDPTTTTLKIMDPSGNVTTVSAGFGAPATGTKTYSFDVDEAGKWWVRFVGTGAAPGVLEEPIWVEASKFS